MNRIQQIGNLYDDKQNYSNREIGRVYAVDGIAPTINTCGGGNRQPKILVEVIGIKIVCERRIDEGLRTFKNNIIGTIRTINSGGDKRVIENNNCDSEYRIRKLTPKECWRLMGFTDEDFNRAKNVGISDTQLYKQAGNSIVTNCLYYIFLELYDAMPYLFEDLKVSSYFSGIGAFEKALDFLYKDINNKT